MLDAHRRRGGAFFLVVCGGPRRRNWTGAFPSIKPVGFNLPNEVAATVGSGGRIVLRTDVVKGKTTIYFAGDSEDEVAKTIRAHATEIKLADVTKQ